MAENNVVGRGIKKLVQASSNTYGVCVHCRYTGNTRGDVAATANHYIEAHGYELLHVGQESDHADGRELWQSTVAILGHTDPPPEREFTGKIELPPKDPE